VVTAEYSRVAEGLRALCQELVEGESGLICRPPAGAAPHRCGDVVPAGILLRALCAYEPVGSSDIERLKLFLAERRRGLLWPYHTGFLPTCIDTGLVLLGWSDPIAVQALEAFGDGRGGYIAQHCAEEPAEGAMRATERSVHWCLPDYGTGVLVAALRSEQGLSPISLVDLGARFEERSGLFFASPYFVDWLLALALSGGGDNALQRRLAVEILSSENADGSFGSDDPHLSTALAILALESLGLAGRALQRSREYLSSCLGADGRWPPATLFYSSERIDESRLPARARFDLALSGRSGQIVRAGDQTFSIALYDDEPGIVTTALTALALTESANTNRLVVEAEDLSPPHRRYRCPDALAYIGEVALPPYAARIS
jgi:hypothetical protein